MYGYDFWEILTNILSLISDPAQHFWFSGLVALLVFWLICLGQFVSFGMVSALKRALSGIWLPISMDVVSVIILSSLLLSLSAAWGLHYFLDGLFNTPLSPPLILEKII